MHPSIDDITWHSYLGSQAIIEGPEEARKRENVMSLLKALVVTFSELYASKQRLIAPPVCQIFPFGSYSLGGHLAGADIDVVCLAPQTVKRREFFYLFSKLLRKNSVVRVIEVVERTAVPIIKCSIDSIMTDISFVSLKQPSIPPNIRLLDDGYLEGLDSICLASMDGPRVNQFIMSKVDPQHIQIFQQAMQSVKHWATQRYIYGKPMGYLNGGTWTLLLLKTYLQGIPEPLSIHGLLRAFFRMWQKWPWPVPVMLTESIPHQRGQTISYKSLPESETAIMPILTPCHPVSFSSPYTTMSTLNVMISEFERDSNFVRPESMLDKLFSPFNILKPYNHFLKVTVSCETQKSHDTWIRKMAVAVPRLVTLLESVEAISKLHPLTKPTNAVQNYKSVYERNRLRAGEDPNTAMENSYATPLSPGMLYMTWYTIGIEVRAPKDISSEIAEFIQTIDEKRNRKDADMLVSVVAIKR
ncbi:Poly(A) polymerase central domain-containing protein [Phycomyces nitens]|nr:Poly(A) polymerase central domain-containing protein [Phycomyces nitens]